MKIIKNAVTILIVIFSMMYSNTSFSQNNPLFQLGKSLVEIAKSDNSDKIIGFTDPKLDLDKKAEILESFLTVKDNLFSNIDKNKIEFFNVIKQNDSTLFIITSGDKFYIIKTRTNDSFKIKERFVIIRNNVLNKGLELGKKIYRLRCYACHGKDGKGGTAPNLTDPYWKYVSSAQDLQEVIMNGKKGAMMIAYKNYLKPEELKAVTLYIKALQGKMHKNPKKKEGEQKNIQFKISNN